MTRQKSSITDRYDEAIERLKAQCQEEQRGIIEEMETRANQVYLYALSKLGELEGRSKSLTFGVIAFHRSTELKLPRDEAGVIIALKQLGREGCIEVTEKVRKLMLKKEDPEIIAAVGGKMVAKDNFRIELPEVSYEYDSKLKMVKK